MRRGPRRAATPTRQQRLRTIAQIKVEVMLCEPPSTPIYQAIAAKAAEMRARRVRVAAIARHFRVDHHTVDKALRWFDGQ